MRDPDELDRMAAAERRLERDLHREPRQVVTRASRRRAVMAELLTRQCELADADSDGD